MQQPILYQETLSKGRKRVHCAGVLHHHLYRQTLDSSSLSTSFSVLSQSVEHQLRYHYPRPIPPIADLHYYPPPTEMEHHQDHHYGPVRGQHTHPSLFCSLLLWSSQGPECALSLLSSMSLTTLARVWPGSRKQASSCIKRREQVRMLPRHTKGHMAHSLQLDTKTSHHNSGATSAI